MPGKKYKAVFTNVYVLVDAYVVGKGGVQLCVLAHCLWYEAMTLAGDIDEAFSQVGWQIESGMK